jgi:dTDP-L-rhamnose 4-epimerase
VYGIGKRDQEELSLTLGKAYGLPTIALRYLNTYGSRQALSNPYTGVCAIMAMRMLLGKRPVLFEDGAQLRDPIHVSDIARATVLAAHAEERAVGRAYNIGAGRPTTVNEMARALAAAIGSTLEPEVTYAFREGDIRHCFGDTSAAARDLGFSARISFDEGARELVRWAETQRPEDHTERANAELKSRGLIR